ncbi:glycosyltransferase family 2 protein [uncultured Brachyspira sp.]|uniref:glycosyltransferase family 2 protein n=1 Tax=uncultured Brachyspira sp. TaxID=221953 RepID=UPI0025DAEED3|nr:glycosyltransferase family 2 protein [uncultured Brachyspira sp.]
MLKRILKFIYSKYDSGIYRIRNIFGIKIVTKPLVNKINVLEEKIDKLIYHNNLNNILLSGYYLDYLSKYSNMNCIYVSVIVIVYNLGEKYLRQCLESVINQTLKNIEIIIVNDNSPNVDDDKLCLEYSLKDSRIKYIKHEKNIGAGGARSTGLKEANGYSLFFVDGDDYLSLNACEIAFYHLIKYDVDVVTFGYFIVNKLKIISSIFLEILPLLYGKSIIESFSLSKINPALWNKLYKRDLLLKLGYDFMVTAYRAQDLNANYKIFTVTNSLINIPFHLYYYNIRYDSKDNTINEKYVTDIFFIFNDLINFIKEKKLDENHKKYINASFLDNAVFYIIKRINSSNCDKEKLKTIFKSKVIEFINLNLDFIDKDYLYKILHKNGLEIN